MVRSVLKPVMAKVMFFILTFITVLSLSSKAGGIVFEIFMNNKLLLKNQYGKVVAGSEVLQLGEADRNENLRILFTSCNATGKTRSVGVRDENNNLLKEWVFTNSSSSDLSMTIPVKDILALQKGKSTASLKLYYFSPDQFRDGQLLAFVPSGNKSTVLQTDGKTKYLPVITASVFTLGALGLFLRRNS